MYAELFIWMLLIGASFCQGNPCIDNIELERSEYRGARCPFKAYKGLCDRQLSHAWYRTSDNSTIVTTIPNQYYCTTVHPIWMNGTLPDVADDIVNRTACVDYGRTDLCEEKLNIMLKNCTGYYVYYLTPPSACDAAYCFGETKYCPPVEPCDHYFYDTFECSENSGTKLCDPISVDGWYKIDGDNVTAIPNTCPEDRSCKPLWINESYPLVADGIVERQVCLSGETCCDKKYNISVKNCGTMVVYNLLNTTECPGRYCYNGTLQTCSFNQGNFQERQKQKWSTIIMFMMVTLLLIYC